MNNPTSEREGDEWEWVEQADAKLRIIKDRTNLITTEDGWLDKERSLKRLKGAYAALERVIDEVDAHDNE